MTLLHADARCDVSAGKESPGAETGLYSGSFPRALEPALAAVHAGEAVALIDDLGLHADCHLFFAARHATTELVSFLVRYTSGFVEVALPGKCADRLGVGPMVPRTLDAGSLPYGVAVDATEGISTGISAADRARTIALLADAGTSPDDLTRPGHVMTYRIHEAGVAGEAAAAAAAYDLVRCAGAGFAAARATLVSERDPIRTARGREAAEWSLQHGIPVVKASAALQLRLDKKYPDEKVSS